MEKITTRQPIHVIGPSIAYLELTMGYFATIESSDAEMLSAWNWTTRLHKSYAPRAYRAARMAGGQVNIDLSHQVVGFRPLPGMAIDHINGSPLDNRRANLRYVTLLENSRNRKNGNNFGFGISHIPAKKHYQVMVARKYVGVYKTLPEAQAAQSAYLIALKYSDVKV